MDVLALLAAVLGIILALVALARASNLQADLANLRKQMAVLKAREHDAAMASAGIPSARETAPASAASVHPPARKPRPGAAPAESAVRDAIAREEAADRPVPTPHRPSPVAAWFESMAQSEEWEAMVGGRWLNRIGALALILGVGFFLKYAFDQNWVSQSVRVVIGVAIGAGLTAGAFQAHRRSYAIFAQGLVGAGTATLYLAVYASYNFYHLVSPLAALTAIAVVTALAFAQALYYDSLAVALLGWIGGFLTPLLFTLQEPNEIGLFVYLYLLLIGVLAILIQRPRWLWLDVPSVIATYGILITWYDRSYSASHLLLTTILLTLMWALFFGYNALITLRLSRTREDLRAAVGILNSVLSYGMLLATLEPHYRGWAAALTFGFAAANGGTLAAMGRIRPLSYATSIRYSVSAVALIVAGTFLATSGYWTADALALEATLLLLFGLRQRVAGVAEAALGTYIVCAGWLAFLPGAFEWESARSFTPIINERALAFAVLAAGLAACAVAAGQWAAQCRWSHRRFDLAFPGLVVAACAVLFGMVTVETNDLFRREMARAAGLDRESLDYARYVALGAVWMVISLAPAWLGVRRNRMSLLSSAAAIFSMGALTSLSVGLAYRPIERFVPVLNIRTALLLLLAALLAGTARVALRRKAENSALQPIGVGLGVGAMMAVFELVSVEINDTFRHLGAASSLRHGTDTGLFLETAILAIAWMLLSLPLVTLGVRRGVRSALALGGIFAAVAVACAFYAGLGWTPTSELGLTAITRALAIAIVVALLLAEAQMLRASDALERWAPLALIGVQATVLVLGFELISAESRDLFRHSIATSRASSASHLRDLEQLTLSIVWLVYGIGLMLLGLWRRTRWIRLGALALFGVVILKIFGYDLSFLAPAYRYISFAGLGVILLGVSFLYQRYRELLLEVA